MARTTPRPTPTATHTLQPLGRHCPLCGETMWAAYHNYRTITTLDDVVHLTLPIRRCLNRACPQLRHPIAPKQRAGWPYPSTSLVSMSLHASVPCAMRSRAGVPEIHQRSRHPQMAVTQRTVTHLLERYNELLTLSLTDTARLQASHPSPGVGHLGPGWPPTRRRP